MVASATGLPAARALARAGRASSVRPNIGQSGRVSLMSAI